MTEAQKAPALSGLLGRKLGMTQLYLEDGRVKGVTVIESGPCLVTQVKTAEKDGYHAVQIAFGQCRPKVGDKPVINKPIDGIFEKIEKPPMRFLREIRLGAASSLESGQLVKVDIFRDVRRVDVTGITKGRGFQGVIKRFGKHRGPETHGSMNVRTTGARGAGSSPGRVRPGTITPGHMGVTRHTSRNLIVDRIDEGRNLLFVRGSVPGPPGQFLIIQKSLKQHVPKPPVVEVAPAKRGARAPEKRKTK